MNQIRRQIEETTSDYDREKLQERLAKLAGGVAVINVGAATETEMKEKKARVEDALHATRAAVEEGIVPGGGVALLRCFAAIDALKLERRRTASAWKSSSAPLKYPLRALAANAGVEGSVVVQEVKKRKGNEGYNVATGEYEDLVKAGVVDPKKVTRTALQNAASIAGLLADHRMPDHRDSGEGKTGSGWHGGRRRRHGRHGLLSLNQGWRAQQRVTLCSAGGTEITSEVGARQPRFCFFWAKAFQESGFEPTTRYGPAVGCLVCRCCFDPFGLSNLARGELKEKKRGRPVA